MSEDLDECEVVGDLCLNGCDQLQEQQHPSCSRYERRGTCSQPLNEQLVSMSGVLVAGIAATSIVTLAHRLPGVLVAFLFDTTEVTFLTRLETCRLITTCLAA